MSVIIRLQNLPLSAVAADVRSFFNGLRIPDGAVHIVGGREGDAFIGFATDEDARQAMRLDRRCIHGEEVFTLTTILQINYQRYMGSYSRAQLFESISSYSMTRQALKNVWSCARRKCVRLGSIQH